MAASLQHVLCIDDDEDILQVAQICLETMANLKVSCCNSGTEGVQRAAEIHPDLILLDVMMPGFDGPSTLKELRKNPQLDTIPIVFMTARVQPSEVVDYLELGAAGVVCKPFDPMTLVDEIKALWTKFHERSSA